VFFFADCDVICCGKYAGLWEMGEQW